MPKIQKRNEMLIRYPGIRGYTLKAHELKEIIAARYEADVFLEEHPEYRLTLILDGEEIYAEKANELAEINHSACIEAIRRNHTAEREQPLSSSQSEPETEDDPDHREWLNCVCSGE